MPQFCTLFYANYTILATQRGGPWPNAPPPKYAPDPAFVVEGFVKNGESAVAVQRSFRRHFLIIQSL